MTLTVQDCAVELHGFGDFDGYLESDLENVFFSGDEFAGPVMVYHQHLRRWEAYNAIYDDPFEDVGLGLEANHSSQSPQLMFHENALKHPLTNGDKVKRRGVTYEVKDPRPDGVGIVTVMLRTR
jgi:hypothetical protein